ncbi:NUDIX hydrolase [Paracoccus aerodenitrificans]|uniref:NUDIX hydrolase n=1 Tax=Paracoccus aerodenitrificans TaxID=3017781 RepID=UPI0022F0682C|nr:NUDIX hydrolase [Paracoccus aerodenitrificans]WBU62693.1 NUDIX hydrolase [Paracoccus aerodenitrificans]
MSGGEPQTAEDKSRLRDAATIILVRRDPERPAILMGMRGKTAAFMPSKYVFPGGAVDPEDADLALAGTADALTLRRLAIEPRTDSAVTPRQILAAALRELAEETGLLIGQPGDSPLPGYAEAGLMPDPSALHFIFRAITPPGRPRRFDARFFLADAAHVSGDPDDFSRACDELSHLHWVPIAEARALHLPFITEVVLAEAAALIRGSGDAALHAPENVPFFDNRDQRSRFVQLGATE